MKHIKKISLEEKDVTVVSGNAGFSPTGGVYLRGGSEAIILTQFVEIGKLSGWIGLNIFGEVSTLGFRLWDGTRDLYWDGVAWSETTTEWNTAEEIVQNFITYANKKFSVRVKFSDASSLLTAIVLGFRVSSSAEEDFILSFLNYLKGIRFELDYAYTTRTAVTVIDLGAQDVLKEYTITGVAAVYNHTSDPNHLNPLSFTFANGKITLASSVSAGKELWILIQVSPVVAFSTSPDYSELEKYPAIIVEAVSPLRSYVISQDLAILAGAGFGATILGETQCEDYQITLVPIAGRLIEHLRLVGSLREYLRENPILLLRDCGLEISLLESEAYTSRSATLAEALPSGSIVVNANGVEQSFREAPGYWIGEFISNLNRR